MDKMDEIFYKYFELISPLYDPDVSDDEVEDIVEELEEFLGFKFSNKTVERLRNLGR